MNAHSSSFLNSEEWDPVDHRWAIVDGRMTVVWFHGQQMPKRLPYIDANEEDVGSDDESASESEESDEAMGSHYTDEEL